jgi:lycopene cyclase CruA
MNAVEQARGRVRESGGPELLERLDHLDAVRKRPRRPDDASLPEPDPNARPDYDVVLVGGGLWSILAPLLAARGLRVAVFDRAKVGLSHREWNASRGELSVLVELGLVTEGQLEAAIVARYDHGTCLFSGGTVYPVRGVLDHAICAGTLLGHARTVAESSGVAMFDGHELSALRPGKRSVSLRFRTPTGAFHETSARYVVDARGFASPSLDADLVCPTVGGVLQGLSEGSAPDQIDPRVGEILATTEGIEEGRQHVWEAFPGRRGETTVYLFYYAESAQAGSLVDLYARFFATLPRYKRGETRLLRPTFGFIPGWSRLTPAPRSPSPRIVLVGDAASRHSPLSYCGFGATLRSLGPVATALAAAVQDDVPPPDPVVDDRPVHAFTGALSALMASGVFRGNQLNELLDAAFGTLYEQGNEAYSALLQDRSSTSELIRFLQRTSVRHPAVWHRVARGLGPWASLKWAKTIATRAIREAASREAR